MSNMRQIIFGVHQYTADYKGRLPGSQIVWIKAPPPTFGHWTTAFNPQDNWLGLDTFMSAMAWTPYGATALGRNGWKYSIAPNDKLGIQRSLWSWVASNAPRRGSLFKYMKDPEVYLCPGDHQGFPEDLNSAGGGGNGTYSYSMNGLLGYKKTENCRQYTYPVDFEQLPYSLPPVFPDGIPAGTKVKWPESDMLLFIEEHPWNNINYGWPRDGIFADSYMSLRHSRDARRGRTSMGYLDGHVKLTVFDFLGGRATGDSDVSQTGVDIWNKMRFPYSWDGNDGGQECVDAFRVKLQGQ